MALFPPSQLFWQSRHVVGDMAGGLSSTLGLGDNYLAPVHDLGSGQANRRSPSGTHHEPASEYKDYM